MKPNIRLRLAVVAAAIFAVALGAMTVTAISSYSDYVVFGEYGVMIGGTSTVVGNVGARFNNTAPYTNQPPAALTMNGGAKILGTANIGEAGSSADATVANNVTVTQLNYVGTFTSGSGFSGTATQQSGGTDLPSGSLASKSVWPGGLGNTCANSASWTDLSYSSNSVAISVTPGNWGEIKAGGTSTLSF